jgi:hypothetical protein
MAEDGGVASTKEEDSQQTQRRSTRLLCLLPPSLAPCLLLRTPVGQSSIR